MVVQPFKIYRGFPVAMLQGAPSNFSHTPLILGDAQTALAGFICTFCNQGCVIWNISGHC